MHSLSFLHRDLRPEHVLITSGKQGEPLAKLSGFGVAYNFSDTQSFESHAGVEFWMAPETAQDQPYNVSAEIFSLGALIFFCINGRIAF
jgi:serine/threonine protein kinase